ncbi:glycosyltransferase family 2 protein [Zunongwangia sp. F260]|uniref:Glycosyltransferase family 2 protein n=1 Tax=Autumnicola lenta TaxID=3075593 RepID=A0ABU3CGF0_9FLAO|nr:glycosyltransferase family 2 protein [Zunongwangia sp. F260]MDT0645312.1 glycosyltransferase family 2 protein [Zunongwangia sp. F260]
MNKVYVIVVTYNGMKWIEECLNSILNSSVPVIPLVIDNFSTDDTVTFVKTKFPNLILWEQNENLGFGKANNLGMSYALKQNADFVFLLNQDAFLEKNTLKKLIQVASKNLDYGILSPIQLDYSGKRLEKYFLKFIADDISTTFYSDFVLKKEINEVYKINFIQAAAWLLPLKTLKIIGGFDPIFYHYGEDNNYCQRLHYHNLKIGIVPDTFVRHDSSNPLNSDLKLFTERYFKNYKKNFCNKYANINISFVDREMLKAKKIIFNKSLKSFFKLNIINARGYLKQLKILNVTTREIERSRKLNIQRGPNYLDFNI